jgi:hypothetical protein
MSISLTFNFLPEIALYRFKPNVNPRWRALNWSQEQGNISGAPDILQLGVGEGPRFEFTRAWQEYLCTLNPNVERSKVAGLLGNGVGFCNGTGFGGDTIYQNWITGEDTDVENSDGSPSLPMFDKVRTCAYNCHSGKVEGDQLLITMMDGNLPPPDIADVNPAKHPFLFVFASIVYVDASGIEISRTHFPKRGAPAWGNERTVTILPLVSKYAVRCPLIHVERVENFTLPYFP